MVQTTQIVLINHWSLHNAQEVGSRFTKVTREKGPSPAINYFKIDHTSTLNR